MSSRTILLDVDDCLIVEIDSPDRAYAAFRGGEEHRPLVVPSDACQLAARGPRGRGPYFHRPSVSKVLRELADRGTDIVWNTQWLTAPALLDRLAEELALANAVRMPRPDELPVPPSDAPIDFGPNVFWEHWKVAALVQRVHDLDPASELVVIDAKLDCTSRRLADGVARRARRTDARVGGIHTYDQRGLDDRGAAWLRSWAEGGYLPLL